MLSYWLKAFSIYKVTVTVTFHLSTWNSMRGHLLLKINATRKFKGHVAMYSQVIDCKQGGMYGQMDWWIDGLSNSHYAAKQYAPFSLKGDLIKEQGEGHTRQPQTPPPSSDTRWTAPPWTPWCWNTTPRGGTCITLKRYVHSRCFHYVFKSYTFSAHELYSLNMNTCKYCLVG